jgi:phospholipase/carboxylesterase
VPIENEPFVTEIDGWTIRVQPPLSSPAKSVIIFLHGWTGGENSMGIFSRGLDSSWKLYPRGPVQLPEGFAWAKTQSVISAQLTDFLPAAGQLNNAIKVWVETFHLEGLPIFLVGFSQGSVMVLALALRFSHFRRIAILSGFLPEGGDEYLINHPLDGKEFFMAHGTLDDIVPVTLARTTMKRLELAGATVHYCEEEVGHKLSKGCFSGLRAFLSQSHLPLEKRNQP